MQHAQQRTWHKLSAQKRLAIITIIYSHFIHGETKKHMASGNTQTQFTRKWWRQNSSFHMFDYRNLTFYSFLYVCDQ